jgi:predicted flavoprotein YhiN
LCGIEIKEDLSLLAWNTVQATITLYCDNKIVYTNKWSLLFTHIGLSGPIIFDATLYMNQDISTYSLQCDFDLASTSKKVIQAFKLVSWDTVRDIRIKALRPMTEAKVSVWWILLKELDQHFQSKKISWLYFIGESLDITGKTWWYNLQRARTSAYVCAKKFQ